MKGKKIIVILCMVLAIIPLFRFVMGFLDYPHLNPPRTWELKEEYKIYIDPDYEFTLKEWVQNLYEFYENERKVLYKFKPERLEELRSKNATKEQTLIYWSEDNEILADVTYDVLEVAYKPLLVPAYRLDNKTEMINILKGTRKWSLENIKARNREIRKIKSEFHKDVQYFLDFFK